VKIIKDKQKIVSCLSVFDFPLQAMLARVKQKLTNKSHTGFSSLLDIVDVKQRGKSKSL